jgi:uncharacterized hydrophobic protein (TIGR00271 family)
MTSTVEESTGTDTARYGRVVVPLANPQTAALLIRLGKALTDPEDGQLLLITIITGDAEAESSAEAIEELREVVGSESDDRFELELDARTAPAIARGILDYTREQNADLVILGVAVSDRAGFSAINEAVMEAIHCGVLAVRPGSEADAVDRIVVGVDGSDQSRTAATVAVLLGEALELPVHALHVRDRTYSRTFARAMLDKSLADLPGPAPAERDVVEASVPGHGISSRVDPSDIIVLGSAKHSRLDNLMSTHTSELVFRRSKATVIVVSQRAGERRSLLTRAITRFRALRPNLTRLERDTVVWNSAAAAPLSTDFIVLLAVSALLASGGLLQNSSAVVIGAMLVAPLLGPLAAVSVGLVTARLGLSARALLTLAAGTVATIATSAAAGLVIPIGAPTSEMLARGSPSLIDLGVAVAAGVVGAYATARKDIPAALAGVAIAAALVPPLCTTGLAISIGDADLAYGSFLLFVTNIVSVVLTGGVVLRWMGLRSNSEGPSGRAAWGTAIVVLVLAFVMVIVGLRSFQGARQAQLAADDLTDLFPNGEVTDVSSQSRDPVIVTATVRTSSEVTAADVAEIEAQLEQRLDQEIRLEVVVERVVVSGGP